MFPKSCEPGSTNFCLPRLGGGVSPYRASHIWALVSSPPRRGCFHDSGPQMNKFSVFPASAGVFLSETPFADDKKGLPRLGGGVSRIAATPRSARKSSPPRRGCFESHKDCLPRRRVFPASAGVFPAISRRIRQEVGLPRLGGGVSPKACSER